MVKLALNGRKFEITNFHDVDIMSYFPEGEGHINGVVQCLSDAFDDDDADDIMEKMTVEELLTVWEEWSRQSNFEFVYDRIYDVMDDERRKKLRLGAWILGSWIVTGIVAIVSLVLLFV